MLVYFYVSLMFMSLFETLSPKPIKQVIRLVLYFFLLVFIGLRDEVGGDWYNYLNIFESVNQQAFKIYYKEYVFYYLNYISNNIYTLNFILAILSVTFFFGSLKAFKIRNYSFFLLICFLPFLLLYTGFSRQSVAVSILMYMYSNCNKNKYIDLILSFLVIGFHLSSSIFIFAKCRLKSANILILICIVLFLGLFYVDAFRFQYSLYVSGIVTSNGVYLRLIFLIPLLSFYFINTNNNKFSSYPYISKFVWIAILLVVVSPILSTIADRFFYPVFFILTPIIFAEVRRSQYKLFFYLTMLCISITTFCIWYANSFWAKCCWIDYKLYY